MDIVGKKHLMKLYLRHITLFFCTIGFTLVLLISSCGKSENVIVTKEYVLNSYSIAYVNAISDIILVQDTGYKMIYKGSEEIFKDISVNIANDTLFITDTRKRLLKIDDRPAMYLHFENLRSLVTFKPATVGNTDTLKLNYFYLYSIGELGEVELTLDCNTFGLDNSANTLGRYVIRGKSDIVYMFNRYGSTIIADNLICREARVINESIGDVYIHAEEILNVYLWATGNIYYTGNPVIQVVEKRDSGRLIKFP